MLEWTPLKKLAAAVGALAAILATIAGITGSVKTIIEPFTGGSTASISIRDVLLGDVAWLEQYPDIRVSLVAANSGDTVARNCRGQLLISDSWTDRDSYHFLMKIDDEPIHVADPFSIGGHTEMRIEFSFYLRNKDPFQKDARVRITCDGKVTNTETFTVPAPSECAKFNPLPPGCEGAMIVTGRGARFQRLMQ